MCIGKEFIETNKALIEIDHDNEVVKKSFKNIKRNKKEYQNLVDLNNIFPEDNYKNWKYKTVKPLYFDYVNNSLVMAKAYGSTLVNKIKNNPELLVHAGLWLGLYHRKTICSGNVVLLYDCSLYNILICDEKREITVIDPGAKFGLMGYPEFDLFLSVGSIISHAKKDYANPIKSIDYFFSGYFEVFNEIISNEGFTKARKMIVNYYLSNSRLNHNILKRLQTKLKIFQLCLFIDYIVRDKLYRYLYGDN